MVPIICPAITMPRSPRGSGALQAFSRGCPTSACSCGKMKSSMRVSMSCTIRCCVSRTGCTPIGNPVCGARVQTKPSANVGGSSPYARSRAQQTTVQRIRRSLQATDIEPDTIAWVERVESESRYEINAAPYEVADFLRETLFKRTQSVVMTSATLAEGTSFAFLRSQLGVDEAQELVAPSPFDYPRQARLVRCAGALQSEKPRFCGACGADYRGVSRTHARTRLRAVHVVRALA